MSTTATFLTGLGITIVLALAVVVYIRRHLAGILLDLCGTRERADFWAAFCSVLLVLVPLIGALTQIPNPGSGRTAFFEVSVQLRAALIALVITLVGIGLVLSSFIEQIAKGAKEQVLEKPPKVL